MSFDRWVRWLGVLAVVVSVQSGSAQAFEGRVLSESGAEPVDGATVRLLDAAGEPLVAALADSLGRFRLEAPEPGEYRIVARHLGYERLASRLLAVGDPSRTYPVELILTPAPIPIEGIEVTAERVEEVERELRQQIGLDPDALRWEPILRPTIVEHLERGHGVPALIRWTRTPGVTVAGAGEDLCFRYRVRTCLPVYLDGARMRPEFVSAITLEMLEAAVVLSPAESVVYPGGAVLLYSTPWMR